MERKQSLWSKLRRLVHLRLVVPLKRSPHPPEYTARGVMLGVFWAFTPLIGIQMYLVVLTWILARWHPRTDFSLIVALAWTWVTNVLTMLPIYYVFYVTGQLFLGHPDEASGYRYFVAQWQEAFAENDQFLDQLYAYARLVANEQGLPMAIGCLPYALGTSWLGYRWSLRFLIERRRRKRRLAAARAAGRAPARAASGPEA